ncbi:hypothetical protein MNBD_CHLOROFLEXI01-3427 [hydrothermal vent metagenome]|uniref:Tellurite resistance methyltransferase TehB-like domain-containing protein n=1 Tax=hydrothermal vent metagenome TaxID=652676 RepID=A0A3B0VXY6_9ZZZZ
MANYNKQYQVEEDLFGVPYKAFESFVKTDALKGGKALDIGCGQGRDALMLAQYGYTVTGIDTSAVGINQMLEQAKARNLSVRGVIANFYDYQLSEQFDAIVLDSILHFEKADREKELALLNRLAVHLNVKGYLFIFVHKSAQKEKLLENWLKEVQTEFDLVKDGYIDYAYEEKSTGFRSAFQYYMFILQRVA